MTISSVISGNDSFSSGTAGLGGTSPSVNFVFYPRNGTIGFLIDLFLLIVDNILLSLLLFRTSFPFPFTFYILILFALLLDIIPYSSCTDNKGRGDGRINDRPSMS